MPDYLIAVTAIETIATGYRATAVLQKVPQQELQLALAQGAYAWQQNMANIPGDQTAVLKTVIHRWFANVNNAGVAATMARIGMVFGAAARGGFPYEHNVFHVVLDATGDTIEVMGSVNNVFDTDAVYDNTPMDQYAEATLQALINGGKLAA